MPAQPQVVCLRKRGQLIGVVEVKLVSVRLQTLHLERVLRHADVELVSQRFPIISVSQKGDGHCRADVEPTLLSKFAQS